MAETDYTPGYAREDGDVALEEDDVDETVHESRHPKSPNSLHFEASAY